MSESTPAAAPAAAAAPSHGVFLPTSGFVNNLTEEQKGQLAKVTSTEK